MTGAPYQYRDSVFTVKKIPAVITRYISYSNEIQATVVERKILAVRLALQAFKPKQNRSQMLYVQRTFKVRF
jgi:hypothetical protein